jgi:hypothetical protein
MRFQMEMKENELSSLGKIQTRLYWGLGFYSIGWGY